MKCTDVRVQLHEFWQFFVHTHVTIAQIKIPNSLTNFFPPSPISAIPPAPFPMVTTNLFSVTV